MDLGCFLLNFAIVVLALSQASCGQKIPTCNNCCQKGNHKTIDNSRRSVKSQWKPGQVALCDKDLQAGWYRFTSFVGGEMPTTRVPENHCGTQHTIWLRPKNKGHPTPATTDPQVEVDACVNLAGRDGGCFFSFKVAIKSCPGNYFVYYLQPTYSCNIAYCAGNEKPCPYGQKGESLKTCKSAQTVKFPSSYLQHPKIEYKPSEGTEKEKEDVTLICVIPIDSQIRHWKNVSYVVNWYADGRFLVAEPEYCLPKKKETLNSKPCPNKKELRSELTGHYSPGQWISCEVKAKYTNHKDNPWSEPVSVTRPFFAGIEVTNSSIIITRCKDPFYVDLTLTPTIPIRLKTGFGLIVKFILPLGLVAEKCLIPLQGTTPVTVKIKATCDTLVKQTKLRVITLKVTNKQENLTFWRYIGLPTVWVTVYKGIDKIHKCKSVTDPHYRLLDKEGSTIWKDFMGHGDFVLYQNKERHFEVQTRQWACNNARSITCNCGVVVRDHHHVIRFSCCGDPPKKKRDSTSLILVDVPREGCLPPGISIKKKWFGSNIGYEVILPSGIRVELKRNYWGIDVTIYTPRTNKPKDETGLCTYKNIDNNRFMDTKFGESNRASPSYFDQLPIEDPKLYDDVLYEESCACSEDKPRTNKCFTGIPVFFPLGFKKQTNYHRIKMCDRKPWKKRKNRETRDTEGSDDLTEDDVKLLQNSAEIETHNRPRRSLNPISKENATRYCAERLAETPVGKLCAKVGTNVQALVNICSSDIEFTGDLSFAVGAVSMLMNECNDALIQNMTANTNNTNSTSDVKIPPIVEEIGQLLCPNDCAFNGKCVNGSCVCNKDFTAEDCSISVHQIPDILRLQANGLCDRRKRPCKKVTVLGTGFLNSTNVTCHIKEIEIVNSSWVPNKNESKYTGIMTDLVLVECLLPESPVMRTQYDENVEGIPAAGLMISVSNNGIHKSKKKLKLISYDSVCMDCNISTGCFLKKKTCLINRYCFAPNEPNPKDWCQQCLPEVDTNTWTKRQVNHPPNVTSITKYYVVYGERLELPIGVIDPEGMPVTISLMQRGPKYAVVQNNILLWNVTTNKTTQFFFKATDACQASSTLNISIAVNVCPCNNSGRCVPQSPRGRGSYLCSCAPGFTGKYCDTEIDECQSYPCLRGDCFDHVNNYSCICEFGFEGRNCDVDIDYCKSSPCVYGNCTDGVNIFTCNCEAGYTGEKCDVDIDECSSSPCVNGTCIDQLNGYKCQCAPGYTGRNCDVNINECQSSPCVNGTCVDKVNGFSCICEAGFTGITCEVNINECFQASCGNGSCVDKVNNYSCICNAGFTGQHCDVVITHCSNDSCYPGIPCTENSNSISCGSCPSGFTGDGKNCKDIDDCVNQTCANGGSCVDGVNSYTCDCQAGFTGDNCESDTDDCVNHTCANGGSCMDGVNSYTCNCSVGFTGGHCETNIDDCVNQTCANGGSCVDGVNSYTCDCQAGFTGDHCESDTDDCVNHTCANGGLCVDGVISYTCNCSVGFTGGHCENNINDCFNVTCKNGGSCIDGINNFTCSCPTGYTGDLCETALTTTVAAETLSPESTSAPSTHEEVATTKRPTEEISDELKTVFTLEIRIKEDWDEKLKDKTSEKFKKLSKLLKEEILKAYSGNSELKEVEIISMRSGSIIADFKLTFKRSVTVKEAMTPLKKETANGKLGTFGVDPDSLKPKSSKQEKKNLEQESSKSNLTLIIGVSCGSFVVLAVLTIFLVFHCKRSSVPSRSNSRVGDGMPADESCSKSEKYELQSTNTKGDKLVWMAEKGVWNEGME